MRHSRNGRLTQLRALVTKLETQAAAPGRDELLRTVRLRIAEIELGQPEEHLTPPATPLADVLARATPAAAAVRGPEPRRPHGRPLGARWEATSAGRLRTPAIRRSWIARRQASRRADPADDEGARRRAGYSSSRARMRMIATSSPEQVSGYTT